MNEQEERTGVIYGDDDKYPLNPTVFGIHQFAKERQKRTIKTSHEK
jgi:hypothetical protein